jgi:hypothetical protein
MDIAAQIFITGGAPPVKGRECYEEGDGGYLRSEERALRELSEDPGTLVKHGGQGNQKQRYCDGDNLAALAYMKFPLDSLLVFVLHHGTSPGIRNTTVPDSVL